MNVETSIFSKVDMYEEESCNGGKTMIIAGTATLAQLAANSDGAGTFGSSGTLRAVFTAAPAAGTLAAFFASPVGLAFAAAERLSATASLSDG
jgi:hypothetical protein